MAICMVALFVTLNLEIGSKEFKMAAIHQRVYHACNLEKNTKFNSHMCKFHCDIESFDSIIEFSDHENKMNCFAVLY
jgi:hypothetical protein